MNKKYPLEPVRQVRKARVDEGVKKLADALGAEERSRVEAEARRRARDEFDSACSGIQRDEQERLEEGGARAADLMRAHAWGLGAKVQRDTHHTAVARAESEVERARERSAEAGQALARAHTDTEVIEKNRATWERSRQAERSQAEELGAEEVHASRAHRRKDA